MQWRWEHQTNSQLHYLLQRCTGTFNHSQDSANKLWGCFAAPDRQPMLYWCSFAVESSGATLQHSAKQSLVDTWGIWKHLVTTLRVMPLCWSSRRSYLHGKAAAHIIKQLKLSFLMALEKYLVIQDQKSEISRKQCIWYDLAAPGEACRDWPFAIDLHSIPDIPWPVQCCSCLAYKHYWVFPPVQQLHQEELALMTKSAEGRNN